MRVLISCVVGIGFCFALAACTVTADGEEIVNVGPENPAPKPAATRVNRESTRPAANVEAASEPYNSAESGDDARRSRIEETLANAAAIEEQVFGGPANDPAPATAPEPEEPAEESASEPALGSTPGTYVRCVDLLSWWLKACDGASALDAAGGDPSTIRLMRELASLLGEALHRAAE